MTAKLVISEHDQLGGLGDDDHVQYLLINGTRAMTGDLDMGSNDINNLVRINQDYEYDQTPGATPGIRAIPDNITKTVLPPVAFQFQWDSVVTSNIGGGGPIGNDTAPGMVGAIGTAVIADPGNLFSTSLLFNQATQLQAQARLGPVYTMVNQPRIFADGIATTCSQHNALRIQPTWGPNINGGSITQTSAQLIFFLATVDANVGAASVTLLQNIIMNNPSLLNGGTIGTWEGINIANIVGPTTIRGIQSAMANGTFINHVGVAPSNFAGSIFMNNGVALVLGTAGGNRVELLRSAAGVLRMIGAGGTNNEGLDWDFDPATADTIDVQSSTGAGLGFNLPVVSIGTSPADPTNNWQFGLTPGAKTITAAGDFARALFAASANVTIDAALTNFATWIINDPAGTIGTGSVVDAANMLIQTAPGVGTNRYGLLITSNPSGGTKNRALEVRNGIAEFGADVLFEGDSAGLSYGAMTNDTGNLITINTQNVWEEVTTGFATGQVHNVTFGGAHYLQVANAGRYLANLSISLESANNEEVGAAVAVNGVEQAAGHAHSTVPGTGDTASMSQTVILDLAANDQVSVAVVNHTSTTDLNIIHCSLSIVYIGGT